MARHEHHEQFVEAVRADRRWAAVAERDSATGRSQPQQVPPPPFGPGIPWRRRPALPDGLGAHPADAAAIIERPARSVTQSGGRSRGWRLRFAPRSRPFHDPLIGWIGGDDPLAHVELTFPTREAAIGYADAQGLAYELRDGAAAQGRRGRTATDPAHTPVALCCWPTGPHALCCGAYPPLGQGGIYAQQT
jgi:hypothetical protein